LNANIDGVSAELFDCYRSKRRAPSMTAIVSTQPATNEQWDAAWLGCDYATYFHSREWADVWSEYTVGRFVPAARQLTFADGRDVVLALSATRRRGGLVTVHVSSPAGTFGGWISTSTLTAQHASALCRYLQKGVGNLQWRMNPYDANLVALGLSLGKNDETHALDLSQGFDAIFRGWTKGHSSAARKAQKAGVTVRLARNVSDWRSYYAVYEDSLRRWGDKASGRYERRFFETLSKRASQYVRLWLAEASGEIVAGALCFYAPSHVVYWHGAALEKCFNLRPVNLLMFEAIKHACEHGFRWFDFNPSGGHEGVVAFKRSFGATARQCPVVTIETRWARLLDTAVYYRRRVFA
jgi:hypothetical protein